MTICLFFAALLLGLWWRESRRRVRHAVKPGVQENVCLPHSVEFELYHNALSLCSMKTRVCLAELNISYRSHPIDLIETGCYENIRPRFLRINPAGTVPVLVHNGHPVYESHEQILYAAANAPVGAPQLTPAAPELIEQMKFWIDESSIKGDPISQGPNNAGNSIPALTGPLFSAMVEEIPLWRIAEGLLFHFDKRRPLFFGALKLFGLNSLHRIKPAMKFHSDSRIAMQRHLEKLEDQLVGNSGPWILGEQFTLADVSWLVIFVRLEQVDSLHLYFESRAESGALPQCERYWQRLQERPSYKEAIVDQQHATVQRGTARLIKAKLENRNLRLALG